MENRGNFSDTIMVKKFTEIFSQQEERVLGDLSEKGK